MKKFGLQFYVSRILAIMDDETLFHHKSTGLEHDDETPASPRGSFHGDFTLEDGELTVASHSPRARTPKNDISVPLRGSNANIHL